MDIRELFFGMQKLSSFLILYDIINRYSEDNNFFFLLFSFHCEVWGHPLIT